jgi:hypothetical protein
MPGCRRLSTAIVGLVAVTSLGACQDIPGIYYQMQHPDLVPKTGCAQLAMVLSERLSLQITSVNASEVKGDSIQCSAQVTNVGAKPTISVDVFLFSGQRMVVDVKEYRWGSAITPSETTNAIGERVLAILQHEFPGVEVVRIRPKQGLFAP